MNTLFPATMLSILGVVANYEFSSPTRNENFAIIRPLVKNWISRNSKKLTIVYDEQMQIEPINKILEILQEFESTRMLVTLKNLTSHDSRSSSYQSIETESFVLIIFSNIYRFRVLLGSDHPRSFWRRKNFYLLEEIREKSSSLDFEETPRHGFLKWAFERLWRSRGIYRIAALIGKKIVRYDPFKYENHLGRRFLLNETLDWLSVKSNENIYRALSVFDSNENISEIARLDHRENFDLYPLKISIFETTTMIKEGDSFRGMDFNYIHAMVQTMNVTPVLVETKDRFGWLENGVFLGTLGDIVYKRVDVTFNQFFVKDYRTHELEFGLSLASDQLCVLVPRAPSIPEYLVVLRVFSPRLWILIFFGQLVLAMIFAVFKQNREIFRVRGKHLERGRRKFGESMAIENSRIANKMRLKSSKKLFILYLPALSRYFLGVVLQLFEPFETSPEWHSERLILMLSLILSLILNGIFTSKLASSFSGFFRYDDIHTLEELEKAELPILTSTRDIIDDALTDDTSSLLKRLHARMEYANETEINRRLFDARDAGLLYRKQIVPLHFDKFQRENLHIVEECPKIYILAHVVTEDSPFLFRINAILGRLNNGGFYDKWFQDMSISHGRYSEENSISSVHRRLTMKHFCIPFVILSIGLATSSIVFVCERRRGNL